MAGWVAILVIGLVIILAVPCPGESNSNGSSVCQPVNEPDNGLETVTIGFLGSYGVIRVALGALPLAVEAVNANKSLLPGMQLKFMAADIGTENGKGPSYAGLAIRKMTEMRDRGALAFIGPDDTCGSEALVASAWDLPIISYKCADMKVSDQKIYHTFARTLPSSSKVSKSVVALLQAFRWKTFSMVYRARWGWVDGIRDAIKELATAHHIEITNTKEFPADYIPRDIESLDKIVDETYTNTRVYVFIGEHIALVDFVNCLERRGLLRRGKYMVISVDDEIYSPNRSRSMWRRDYIDPYISDGHLSDITAFRSVLKLTPSYPRNPDYEIICSRIRNLSINAPFCVPHHHLITDSIEVPIHAAYIYDAVLIYARALTEVYQAGLDPRNGSALLDRIRNRTYHSIVGHDVWIDGNGDAEGNYSVISLLDVEDSNSSAMQPVGYFLSNGSSDQLPVFKYYNNSRPIAWVGGAPPLSEPVCGFYGERCESKTEWRVVLTATFIAFLLAVGIFMAFKHYRYEQKLASLLWKIDSRDIMIIPTPASEHKISGMRGHRGVLHVAGSIAIAPDSTENTPKRAYTNIALFKGNIVAIKVIHKRSFDLTRSIRKELTQIREVRHENLIQFIGACVEHNHVMIVTPYCARGSLADVLANPDVHLDHMFASSLIADLLRGLIYLHDSDIISHGNLRSSNCLIDSRWVLQLADFGLHEFKAGQEDEDHKKRMNERLWRAPELLRNPHHPARGTQKGDVYSFGILLYEILGRQGPWGLIGLSTDEIVWRVMNPGPEGIFRPRVEDIRAAPYVIHCMEACWEEDPEIRPDIRYVHFKLKEMQAGLKPNIFDNMLAIMEKYASNLEALVSERTDQLTEEKKKTEALLHRMLPKSVAEALKTGNQVEAESFDCVTIYFSDIVGFTELSATSTPFQIVELLNDLYTCCDSILSHYDVYKVETIGDAYMVVSGLPLRNGDRHAGEVASMALHMLRQVRRFEVKHRRGEPLRLRIGIHSGHCVAGVVGLKMPRYCLFGDTVNTASRMESTGEAFKIHISRDTKELLDRVGGYYCQERGMTPIKGKGEMLTYWLRGEDPAKRLARMRRDTSSSSFGTNSNSSAPNMSGIPDLLICPFGQRVSRNSSQELESNDVYDLHVRALRSCYVQEPLEGVAAVSCSNLSQASLTHLAMRKKIKTRVPSSAPCVTFMDGQHFL